MSFLEIISALAERPAIPFIGAFLAAWLFDVCHEWWRRRNSARAGNAMNRQQEA